MVTECNTYAFLHGVIMGSYCLDSYIQEAHMLKDCPSDAVSGENIRQPIASMPGVDRITLDLVPAAAAEVTDRDSLLFMYIPVFREL